VVNLFFYLLALGAVVTAIGVLAARNPVMSVISLLGSFFCVSMIYLLAGFQLMAALQILVYGGAIMVLFLFVVMLLNLGDVNEATVHEPIFRSDGRAVAAIGVAAALLVAIAIAILRSDLAAGSPVPENGFDSLSGLAQMMFSRYSLPFEAASVLLLATAVGVMVLAKRNRPGRDASEGGDA